MMMGSAFYGHYKTWGRLLAKQGFAVLMVDSQLLDAFFRAGGGAVSRGLERLRSGLSLGTPTGGGLEAGRR